MEAAREILRQNIIMPTTSNDEGFKNLPDGDLLFYPYSAFIRELYNNASQLRQLMKPRLDSWDACKKKPATKQMKKKPAKAKKQSKTNQRKKSLSKAEEKKLKKLTSSRR